MNPPKIKSEDFIGINGVGIDFILHPHFEIWQEYFKNGYKIRQDTIVILFIPCAAIKPYYNSPIHRSFNRIIDQYNTIQKLVISNAGIIPYEFCNQYPFNSYDWNPLLETQEIKQKYIEITSQRIYGFFKPKEFEKEIRYITYLRNDSESLKALINAFEKLNRNLEIIEISGTLHSTADTDLLLLLDENLKKLDSLLKNHLGN